MNNKTVWKNLFFMKREQAFNAVTMFYSGTTFKKEGIDKLRRADKELFTIKPIQEYTKIQDIPYSRPHLGNVNNNYTSEEE